MKNWILALAFLPLIGCATIPQGTAPSSSPLINQAGNEAKYNVVGKSSASAGSFSLFGIIPFGRANIDQAINEAIQKRGGDNLINICYNVSSFSYLFFGTSTSIDVEGDVIKYTSGLEKEQITSNPKINYQPEKPKLPMSHQLAVNIFSSGTAINYSLIFPFNKFVFGKFSIGYRGYEEKQTYNYSYGQYSYSYDYTSKYSFIPITFSVGVNSEKLIQTEIPVDGFALAGLGYYPDKERMDGGGDLKDKGWLNFGYNIGLGAEYKVIPQLALGIAYNYHQIFVGENKVLNSFGYFGSNTGNEKPSFSEFGIFLRFIP